MIRLWPHDDSVEWLAPVDFVLSLAVVEAVAQTRPPRVLEVGVWKGGWSLTLAVNCPSAVFTGIDPYPGSFAPVRERLLSSSQRVGGRFHLLESWAELDSELIGMTSGFDVIHLDGEHTEPAMAQDLTRAAGVLAPDGVIIVDDIAHPYFPGIASATYRFLDEQGFAVFLYSEHKAYLARRQFHAGWLECVRAMLAEGPLIVERHFQEKDVPPPAYVQLPDIGGHPLLLCVHPANHALALAMLPPSPEAPPDAAPGVPQISTEESLTALRHERDDLAARVRDLVGSRSWRSTAWLRAVRELFGRGA
ncbi:hypothetical protein BH09ACT5_BH09ACT5_24230 [soil metagenome]